jgi:hypothetical protein
MSYKRFRCSLGDKRGRNRVGVGLVIYLSKLLFLLLICSLIDVLGLFGPCFQAGRPRPSSMAAHTPHGFGKDAALTQHNPARQLAEPRKQN